MAKLLINTPVVVVVWKQGRLEDDVPDKFKYLVEFGCETSFPGATFQAQHIYRYEGNILFSRQLWFGPS